MQPKRFESLDGFRGICAVIVAVFHCDTFLLSGHLLNHGFLSVDAFFILSGFVIALTYEDRLSQGMGFWDFLVKRGKRLVPTHLIGTAFVVLVAIWMFKTGDLEIDLTPSMLALYTVLGFLLLPNLFFSGQGSFPVNSVLWSLSCEWIVNIAYARLLFRFRMEWLLIIVAALWTLLAFFSIHSPTGLLFGPTPSNFWLGLVRGFAGFIAGVVIFRLGRGGYLQKLPSIQPELIYALFFLATTIPTLGPTPIFDLTVWLLLLPAVALLVRSDRPVPKFYVWLGAISYPLYVSQLAAIRLISPFIAPLGAKHSVLFAIPMLCGAFALAWLIMLATRRRNAAVGVPVAVQSTLDA
jgi:peptidoglycan/LPS O-acetylase OafA/YrhL